MAANKKLTSVNIRMYRQGFGDCFLLTFHYEDPKETKRMMIDFGVLKASGKEEKMEAVAQNILDETDKEIDVLVVTHEHWDHFSGFISARNTISSLEVKKLWLAWTEEGKNRSVIELKNRKKAIRNSINLGLLQLDNEYQKIADDKPNKRRKEALKKRLDNINQLLEFESSNSSSDKTGLTGILSDIWDNLETKTIFHETGKIIDLDWGGVRIYVLGPPEQWEYLRKNESSADGELYLIEKVLEMSSEISFNNPNTFINSYLFATEQGKEKWSDENIPFDEHWALYKIDKVTDKIVFNPLEDQALRESEQKRIIDNIKESEVFKAYTSEDNIRRIDRDYLSYIEPLAMKLNSHTNNTSLVLAIELIDSGKVLLFPGDAQYGNWLSWTDKKLEWEIPLKDGKKEKVSVEDLLARTVFYKVSHHCSHNGTPQERGLELMKDKNLIAAVPVNEADAKGKGWDRIPYEHIMNRLQQKVKTVNGKPAILRSDTNFASSYTKDDEIQGDTNELYFDIKIKNE